MALTADQIESFKSDGFLIVEDFVEPDTLDLWREQSWRRFESSMDDPKSWPDMQTVEEFDFEPPEKTFIRLPKTNALCEHFGGGAFYGKEEMLMQWPQPPGTEWTMPAGHIDGYGSNGWSPFMFGATIYLYDVEAGGGAFIYWPKSHLSTLDFFLERPDQIDGSFLDAEGWSWNMIRDRTPEPPREFAARAGDVIFWHCYLVHCGSINVRNTPRFGLIARWFHDRKEQIKHEVSKDLWKHWAI
jgi:hypothetical protein